MPFDYNGRKPFERPRKLEELELQQFKDEVIPNEASRSTERDDATDTLFSNLAKTYIKGDKLQKALAKMDPAQFIPIEEFADSTRAAALRLDESQSKKGSIITYSLYQKAVDIILKKEMGDKRNCY